MAKTDSSLWELPGTEKQPEEARMQKLMEFVADDSLKKNQPPAYYRKRLERLKEIIEEYIDASESMNPD